MESIFGKSSENLRKVFLKMEAYDWLLKIVGRQTMTSCLNIAPKKLISLTRWDTCDPIFRRHCGSLESVGKGSGIFGKARVKKRGEGWMGEEKIREGWVGKDKKSGRDGVGWMMTSSKK